jgi:hypothetical protein
MDSPPLALRTAVADLLPEQFVTPHGPLVDNLKRLEKIGV